MDRQVRVIGAPMDLGADRRGVDMGPSAIRYAGLVDEIESVGHDCVDDGDVDVPSPEQVAPDRGAPSTGRAKYFGPTATVCQRLADRVDETIGDGEFPLVLGGDHSIAIGTVNGASRHDDLGVVWFDAHGDFNTPETTPSGNVHGMSVAAILGLGSFADREWAHAPSVPEENVALVGLRTLDEGERTAIRESDVTAYTMTDVDKRGITEVTREALDAVRDGVDAVHVSLDMDFLDPTEAPGVGTPVRGGASYREGHAAMEEVARAAGDDLASMELVEANPILDTNNQTAELAVELAASGLGKRIL